MNMPMNARSNAAPAPFSFPGFATGEKSPVAEIDCQKRFRIVDLRVYGPSKGLTTQALYRKATLAKAIL